MPKSNKGILCLRCGTQLNPGAKAYCSHLCWSTSRTKPTEDLFFSHVKKLKGGCWLWTARLFPNGYGQFIRPKLKEVYAHRVSYILHNSSIPEGLSVLHTCDNPSCVNPKHLVVGTQKQNMDDMHLKGRGAVGERCGLAKLREVDVVQILEDYHRYKKPGALAVRYGVHYQTIIKIVKGVTWKHLKRTQFK